MPNDPHPIDFLLAIMQEVRDSSSLDLNPHEPGCPRFVCGCAHSKRHISAWAAFHAALDEAGVPRLAVLESAHREAAFVRGPS